jgi:cysteinyl-tRNA synthetase
MDGEKMSKSLGNIFLVNDLLEQYPGETLRLSLLSSHYKQPLNWNTDIIEQAQKNLDRLYRVLKENINIDIDKKSKPSEEVMKALSDDLNSSLAIYEINSIADNLSKCIPEEKSFLKAQLISSGKILGILQNCPNKWLKYGRTNNNIDSNLIEELLNKRKEARENKNFTEADKIRNKLKEMGIEIEDTSDGAIWRSQN